MAFLVIGDLHIHTTNLDESEDLSRNLLRIAEEQNFDVIVLLGDILHTNNIIKSEALVLAVDLLSKLSERAPLLILMGNHDIPGPQDYFSKYHGFSALKLWEGTSRENVRFPSGKGVQIVDTEGVTFHVNDVPFSALPYISPGSFQTALNTIPDWEKSGIVFCHQELDGCDLGFGHVSKTEDRWNSALPQIISGHIHKYQKIGSNILYTGTPRQVSINEEPYKTVSLIEYNTGKIKETRISTQLPARLHLKIKATEIDNIQLPKTGKVKIEITGTAIEIIIAKKNPKLIKWKKRGFVVKFYKLTIEVEKEDDTPKVGFKHLCRIRAEEEGLIDEYNEIFG